MTSSGHSVSSDFHSLVDREITPLLLRHGFQPEDWRGEPPSVRAFRNQDRYVEVRLSFHPADFPDFCSVILGEGPPTLPERDWNHVYLQRLVQAHPDAEGGGSPYNPWTEGLERTVSRMASDLERYGRDFLQGDVTRFREARAAMNRDRQPYLIHRPAPGGGMTTQVDPESLALKERFSRTDPAT